MNPDFALKNITLQELQPLLRKKLGDELIVDEFTTKSLLPPGENYGSTILSVDAVIRKNRDAEKENLFLIAKMPPPTLFQMRMFESPYTFRKEIFMYEEILPAYNQLEIEQGTPKDQVFDVLPKYYGSRLSLDPNMDFDDNAVILMENLKNRGYYVGKRSEGYDYEHSKLAVRALARFHALGIAIKYKKPQQFEVFKARSKSLTPNLKDFEGLHDALWDKIRNDEVLGQYAERCKKAVLLKPEEMIALWTTTPDEPWATIIHADFWVNNIMFRRGDDGKVNDVKFVDFQNYLYFNPIREIVFYIYSSTDKNVQENHIPDLIDLYYETFLRTLTKMGCDTTPFNRKSFDEHIPQSASLEFLHLCFMIKVLTLNAKEIEMDYDKIKDMMVGYQGNQLYLDRLRKLILHFLEQNWI